MLAPAVVSQQRVQLPEGLIDRGDGGEPGVDDRQPAGEGLESGVQRRGVLGVAQVAGHVAEEAEPEQARDADVSHRSGAREVVAGRGPRRRRAACSRWPSSRWRYGTRNRCTGESSPMPRMTSCDLVESSLLPAQGPQGVERGGHGVRRPDLVGQAEALQDERFRLVGRPGEQRQAGPADDDPPPVERVVELGGEPFEDVELVGVGVEVARFERGRCTASGAPRPARRDHRGAGRGR